MKIGWILLTLVCLFSSLLPAQQLKRQTIYLGAMGGFATLSGDGSSVITSSSASTSLFDPQNGGAAEAFAGIHLFEFVSFQADYVWNRNPVTLVSTTENRSTASFYQQPENVTQNAFLGNVLIYFRRRGDLIRPFLSEGIGGVLIHNQSSGGAIVGGNPVLPPASSNHASIALRTLVGTDLRLRRGWVFRYTFGETISRNTFGDQLSPPEHRIPKNFQNLFGVYFQF